MGRMYHHQCPLLYRHRDEAGVLQYGKTARNSISKNVVKSHLHACSLILSQLYHFDILHRARQWHCRALCKISKCNSTISVNVMKGRDFARVQLKMNFGPIPYVAMVPECVTRQYRDAM